MMQMIQITAFTLCASLALGAPIVEDRRQLRGGSNMWACQYTNAQDAMDAIAALGCDVSAHDCSQACADGFMPMYRECAAILAPNMATLGPFTAICSATINPLSGDTTTGRGGQGAFGGGNTGRLGGGGRKACDSATTLPTVLECSEWTATALADGVINADDNFCASSCQASLAPLWQECDGRMSQAQQAQLGALAPLLSGCARDPAATAATACDLRRLTKECGADLAAAATQCNPRCTRALDTLATPCASADAWAPYQPIVDACKQAHEVSICQATSTNFLATLDASCCRDQDCTTLPDACTPECASSYMPFFSRCGTTVFGTSDALLAQFTDFNTKCAASTGRNTHTGPRTHLRGPDANDVCSATTDCNGCAGSCGWCKDEITRPGMLQRFGGGWCSSECVTTDGECDAVDVTVDPTTGAITDPAGNH